MGIEKLKGSLLSEANEDARKIVEAAQSHVDGMLREERSRKSAIKERAEKDVERLLSEQRNERIAWARLESKRIIAEAREDALKNVLEAFFDGLKDVRSSTEYKKFLKGAVSQAAAELGDATIHLAKGDKKLVTIPKGCKVAEDLEGLGGALIESADGKIRMDFTLETMFELQRDEVRKKVSDKLFGGR
ncbi:MAG: V-type ATP synthase subunit E family protein [Candidatus Micrarchaeota archaeon]